MVQSGMKENNWFHWPEHSHPINDDPGYILSPLKSTHNGGGGGGGGGRETSDEEEDDDASLMSIDPSVRVPQNGTNPIAAATAWGSPDLAHVSSAWLPLPEAENDVICTDCWGSGLKGSGLMMLLSWQNISDWGFSRSDWGRGHLPSTNVTLDPSVQGPIEMFRRCCEGMLVVGDEEDV